MNTTVQFENEKPASVWPYVLWLPILALGFYNLVYLREVAISILIVAGMETKLMMLADKVGFFFFGVLGLLLILLTEPYLRNGWKQGQFMNRFFKLTTLFFALLSILWATLMVLPGLADEARPTIGALAFTALCLVVSAGLFQRASALR